MKHREGETVRDSDRWTEGGGERCMTSYNVLKLRSMEWWGRGGRIEDGWMFRVREERTWGGGTAGEIDEWSEGGTVLGYTADGSFERREGVVEVALQIIHFFYPTFLFFDKFSVVEWCQLHSLCCNFEVLIVVFLLLLHDMSEGNVFHSIYLTALVSIYFTDWGI